MNDGKAYDVTGDIHGHLGKLEALLRALGYASDGAGWVPPPGRQAVFLGDLIDRGPQQVEVIRLVRGMVERGDALCILGNHELNAIGWFDGLRNRSPNKRAQHAEFLRQVGEGSQLHREIVDWLRGLPLFLDLGDIRVVHAWWHPQSLEVIAESYWNGQRICDRFLRAAFEKGSPVWHAVEGVSKGLEVRLPDGASFVDHAGVERKEVRIRWWLDDVGSLREAAIVPGEQEDAVPDVPLPPGCELGVPAGAPVFVGHYWMRGRPRLLAPRLACLDWSVGGDGPAVAYRWDGEAELSEDRLVAAGA
ncbi:MAG: metallophosphoesterase [Rubrivivax sp.]